MLGDEQSHDSERDGESGTGGVEPKRRGWPKGKPRKLKEETMAEQPDPMEALKEILAAMNAQNREQMMDFARELKKPSEREQRKLNEEDARIARANEEQLSLAKAEMARRENNRLNCPHARVNTATGVSRHMWRGQVHAPLGVQPYTVPTCQMCQTQVGRIPVTPDMMMNGVNLDQYVGLNYDALVKWSEQYKA